MKINKRLQNTYLIPNVQSMPSYQRNIQNGSMKRSLEFTKMTQLMLILQLTQMQ